MSFNSEDVPFLDPNIKPIVARKLGLTVCQNGFLDSETGASVSDAMAVSLMINNKATKAIIQVSMSRVTSGFAAFFWGVHFPKAFKKRFAGIQEGRPFPKKIVDKKRKG